jgi:hypothetical protein
VDLNFDIENAVNRNLHIEEIIAKEEAHDEHPDNSRRRPKPIPQDWDLEF